MSRWLLSSTSSNRWPVPKSRLATPPARTGTGIATPVLGLLVDSEVDLSTRNGNARVFINSRYLNVIKSGGYQQDRHQQRPFINMVDSW